MMQSAEKHAEETRIAIARANIAEAWRKCGFAGSPPTA
jgi:hypothetical protein